MSSGRTYFLIGRTRGTRLRLPLERSESEASSPPSSVQWLFHPAFEYQSGTSEKHATRATTAAATVSRRDTVTIGLTITQDAQTRFVGEFTSVVFISGIRRWRKRDQERQQGEAEDDTDTSQRSGAVVRGRRDIDQCQGNTEQERFRSVYPCVQSHPRVGECPEGLSAA